MNEKVQAFVEKKKQEEEAGKLAYRLKIMKNAGLTRKEYAPDKEHEDAYPHYDYDEMRYYKLVCEDITDEEFALVESYVNRAPEEEEEESGMFSDIGGKIKSVATTVFWVGLLVSIFAGIIMMAMGDAMILLGLITAVVGGLGSWLGSLFLYGFGELIAKTVQIEKNTRR